MADVGQRAVEGDAVADVDVEPVLPVGLVHLVRVSQREGLALLPVTWVKHTHTHTGQLSTYPCFGKTAIQN